MRIGVFGGTFDPVHWGHLRLAEYCEQQASLDRVIFVPAAQQPHKPHAPRASDADRVAMLDLAIVDHPTWSVSTIELKRGGRSYTVHTLRELRAQLPGAEFFLMMGADSLVDLPRWREAAEICRLATPLVVRRPESPEPDFGALAPLVSPERLAEIRRYRIEMPATPISSSAMQQLIRAGGQWRSLTPPAVADYIVERGLYDSTPSIGKG
jgi:nicotinate-nucleotide adenylyltransferase